MRILVILLLVLMISCQAQPEEAPMEQVTGKHVQDLEKTACHAADEAGTCSTKLAKLGFITKEECCRTYEKCC